MKRAFLILFAFATIVSARQITTSNYTNTPYRERMKSSVSSAILIGVPGTATAADTCVGTYIYSFQMHQFPVEKSGFYLLYEDVLGGTSYTRRTDWSTISGKYVSGKSTAWPEPNSIFDYIDVHKGSPVWNDSILFKNPDQGRDSSFFNVGMDSALAPYGGIIKIRKPAYIEIPGNVIIGASRNYHNNGGFNPTISIAGTHDVTLSGGVVYGKADSSSSYPAQTEHDAAISIAASNDVKIRDMNIQYPAGDGITVEYIGHPTLSGVDTTYYKVDSKRVNIHGVTINCPTVAPWNHPISHQIGRNAIALIGGKDIVIDGCYLSGGVPAVIDFEGNSSADTISSVTVTNCIIDGLSLGAYRVGKVISDTQFYLKGIGRTMSFDEDELVNTKCTMPDGGVVASAYGTTVDDWQTIVSNTAASGGTSTITVSSTWDSDPTGLYAVIYDFDSEWPEVPEPESVFGDYEVTGYGTYTITVTGISVTTNQLAGHKLYLTSSPAAGIVSTIKSNSASANDSMLVELNESFNGMTIISGDYMYLGDSYGSGITIQGVPKYTHIIISNNIIRNCSRYGIYLGASGDSINHVTIANNRIENCSLQGIEIAPTAHYVNVTGNDIRYCNIGINDRGTSHHLISDNSIYSCEVGGIWVLGAAGNDSTGTLHDINILNNRIVDCGPDTDENSRAARVEWSRNSTVSGNVFSHATCDTGYAMLFYKCSNLIAGVNTVNHGYKGVVWVQIGCTFSNALISSGNKSVGINYDSRTYPFTVADSANMGEVNYTAIAGGVIYPNAVNPKNKIAISGGHLFIQGSAISSLSVTDSSGARKDLVVATIDTNDVKYISLQGKLTMPELELPNNYDAKNIGEFWINASHDTLWYAINGSSAVYFLIDGTSSKH